MDIVSLLTSINKISLIAFCITFGFISYQVFLLKKETKIRKNKPVIPDFKVSAKIKSSTFTKIIIDDEQKTTVKRFNKAPIIIGFIFLIVFGLVSISGFFNFGAVSKSVSPSVVTSPIIKLVASNGIKIYNKNWVQIPDSELSALIPGQSIIIGVETIAGAGVDMARIRVNDVSWKPVYETAKFNKDKNVFYREYTIATGKASLKIEAQLHSENDGWLGK